MNDAHDIVATLLPVIIMLTLGICAALASRIIRLSPIVGYLVLGIGIGIWEPHYITMGSVVRLLAELGVVFLLFDIGLHFSISHVREQASDIFGFGSLQVTAATVALGTVAWIAGCPPVAAFLIGATLALSSTAVVAGIISERHQRTCPVGLTATAILVFQDVAAIFLLILATALESGNVLPTLGLALIKSIIALCAVVVAARYLVRPLFAFVSRHGGEEVFTGVALVIALAAGWAAASAGLSMTLGAFLGGMVVAESPFRATVRAEISPFRGLLLGFFFMSVGASLDLHAIAAGWISILVMAIGIVTVKVGTNALSAMVFRWSVPGSVQLGFLLSQGSEFAFVVLGLPGVRALIGDPVASNLVAAVALTIAATPAISGAGRQLAGSLRMRNERRTYWELEPKREIEPVLVIGMGRIGRAVADALTEFGIGYLAVEKDLSRLKNGLADGYQLHFGDASDPRLYQAFEMKSRRFSVTTIPGGVVERDWHSTREAFFPGVRHLVVAFDQVSAGHMKRLGFEVMVEREDPPGLCTARFLLEQFAIDPDKIETWSSRWLGQRGVDAPIAAPCPIPITG